MKGTYGKRNNSWYFSVDLGKYPNGKRKRKWVSGFKTKKEAEKACNELIYKYAHNEIPEVKDMNLHSYLYLWLEQYAKNNVKGNTYDNYVLNIERHIVPLIGSIKLEKLTPLSIQDFYSKLSTENALGNTTINYIHRLLNNALKQAVKWNLITFNPCNAVTPPRKDKYEARTLTEIEVSKLLDACQNDIMYTPILIACTTGMRRSEIVGLRWSDINFTEKTISVRHTYQKIGNEYKLMTPKNKKSSRSIAMFDVLAAHLFKMRKIYLKNKLKYGSTFHDSDHVCCWEDGKPIPPYCIYNAFKKISKESNITQVRFHDLRHTHATLLLSAGIPAKITSERLGHSNISTTMDLYSHVTPNMQREAADKLEGLMFHK